MELLSAAAGEIFVTAAIALISYYFKKLSKKLSEQEKVKDGVVAILQDRIMCIGTSILSQGEVTLGEMKNFENLYGVYHSLGGNSTGTEIFNRVKSLKIKEEDQ